MEAERLWWEADAALSAAAGDEVLDEAYEIYVAEAARSRMVDLCGEGTIRLRCGRDVTGTLGALPPVEGHLVVADASAATSLVPLRAVVSMTGTFAHLRNELAHDTAHHREQRLTGWLRDAWGTGVLIEILTCDSEVRRGRLAWVGADAVVVESPDPARGDASLEVVIAHDAVERWSIREQLSDR
ncbi:MAG: hypothetical protein K9G24_01485 [Candidatus Nanopelagicales bacterium]|nr:hypothetical protein [Candidatus Nanopelagicales bacterium]MCF8536648.1 hypothetical protein [Candidatus Nanopelagicales bacterium]MCF8541732.1 hypothetical protein [Candidatus Nanopelagicales bacterium]MCF8556047.1 hypothetical protein [Candidatus Nanopelagicales bacterium]